jgi:hypothetical protein
MKQLVSIFAAQLCVTAFAWGQMPGMANHPIRRIDSSASSPAPNSSTVTFTKDVAPIVQQHCQTCHRPGEGAPFSMVTYEDAKPWAKARRHISASPAVLHSGQRNS